MTLMNNEKIQQAREFLRQRFPEIPVPQRSYLVLMSARSGSMLLCAQLEKIGFGRPIEAFNPNKNPMFQNVWDIDYSNDYEYLKKAIEYQTVNGVMGMKFSLNQFHLFLEKARRLLGEPGAQLTDAEVVEVFFPGTRYIHLQRRDKVKQAISYAKAWQNGIWYEAADGGEEFKEHLLPAVYDREHIECCFDIVLSIDAAWQDYLEENQLQFLQVWYEDLAADFGGKMRDVYDFLEVQEEALPVPPLKKQANLQSQEWEKRFRAQTPWLSNPRIAVALQAGDIRALMAERNPISPLERANARWEVMPANRFKPLRSIVFRVKRKLKNLFSHADH